MKAPRFELPICCESHIHRFAPVPETDEERAAVEAAVERWSEEYYWEGWYRRAEYPSYVLALLERVPAS